MRNDFESNFLAHHGILGMSWGHRNGPPYPLDSGSHSAKEKRMGWMQSLKSKSEAKKKKKKQQAALDKARKARAEKAKQAKLQKEYDEKKQQILKSGKASEVMKYKGQMTNQELNDALNRIRWENDLAKLSAAETKSNFDKVDSIMQKVGTMTDWVNKGVNAYNALDRAAKIFEGGDNDRSSIKKVVDRGDLSEIKKYESKMTAEEARKAWENYNTRKKIKES